MKKSILSLLVLSSFTKLVFPQSFDNQQRISIPSPNVMSFAVFDNFPAVPNTGIPDISIPVYDFKYREISIPINLRYNTALVKPDIQPSWAGLGWNLDVGGQITRVVNDKPDDLEYIDNYVYLRTGEAKVGYWYNHAFFKNDGWNNEIKVKEAADDWRNYSGYIAYLGYPASVKDYQPDDFVFSFLGISGKFYLDADRKWRVKCDQKIRVEVDDLDVSTKGFLKITLTDTKGIKYIFGGNENAIEYANSLFFTYKQRLQAKSWSLSKIILSNNEEIIFNYKKVHPSVNATPSFFSNTPVSPSFPNGGMLHAGSVTVPSYLERIDAPNGKIEFNSSNSTQLGFDRNKFAYMEARIGKTLIDAMNSVAAGSPPLNWDFEQNVFPVPNRVNENLVPTSSLIGLKLDEISIKNKIGAAVKSFKFSYTNNANERLKLLKFEAGNKAPDTILSTYQFSYNSLKLPEYLSSKTDHWGFYNGKILDLSSNSAFYNSRLPDTEYAKAEVLNKVEYPTGGYSTYEFEGNSYSKELDVIKSNPLLSYSQDKITGGLRIKKIINFSGPNQIANSKEFKYVSGYSVSSQNQPSSGVLGGKSIYEPYILSNGSISAVNVQSLYPLSSSANGSHITYSEVVEKYVEGYQVNHYSNFDTGINGEYMDGSPDFSIGDNNQTYNERDFERGLLLLRETFNNSGVLVSKSQIKYERIIDENDFVKNIKAMVIGTAVPGNPSASTFTGYKGSYYKKFTYAYLPIEEVNIGYDLLGSNPVSTLKKYEYDLNTKNLKSESFLNSKDNFVKKANLFAYDMVALNRDPEYIYQAMVSKNMISSVIEQTETNNNNQISLRRTNYGKFTTNDLLLPKSIEEQIGSGPIETKYIFNKYDVFGNLLETQNTNSPKTSYYWGYDRQYPVAQIIGSDYVTASALVDQSILDNANGQYTQTQVRSELNKFRIGLPNAQAVTYTYDPLIGLTSQTDVKDRTTYYEYDVFGRLKNIRDNEQNITKSFVYNNLSTQAEWVNTGLNTACETIEDADYGNQTVNTGNITIEQKDINPNSATYNQTRRISSSNTSLPCPPSYYFTYVTDPYMASVSINAKRSYDDNTTKTMRFRVRHDSVQWGSQLFEEIVDIIISSQNQNVGQGWLQVNAATYLEVELIDVF